MASIMVNYAAMSNGHDGLVATWNRIEGHLADLDAHVAGTADMTADTLISYRALKARWEASAEQRQAVLQALATLVGSAGEQYRQVDASMAAQFG
jgi:uncharacterized protein YukE